MTMRTDGDITIYVLKHREGKRWVTSSLEFFKFGGRPERSVKAKFSCGEVWQTYGIVGVLNKQTGLAGLGQISKGNPEKRFGLFELHISQRTELVATSKFPAVPGKEEVEAALA